MKKLIRCRPTVITYEIGSIYDAHNALYSSVGSPNARIVGYNNYCT